MQGSLGTRLISQGKAVGVLPYFITSTLSRDFARAEVSSKLHVSSYDKRLDYDGNLKVYS